MNYIFYILIAFSIVIGIFNNTLQDVTNSMLEACNLAVKISFSLIGIMTFWLGIMKIAEKAGFIKMISYLFLPISKILFKDIKDNSEATGNIALSLSANALGLANAATPIGLKVMQELQKDNNDKNVATDSMCMFLAMNTAGFQIIPATVLAVLVGFGAKNPSEIIIPTFIVTSLAFISAIVLALIFKFLWKYFEDKKTC